MRVAAVMPTYNQEDFLEAALRSIVNQVDLLVVVDDASTDGTPFILQRWVRDRVVIFRNEKNAGTAEAINAGVRILKNVRDTEDWWTWVSSDNVYAPDWREALEECCGANVGAIYSGFERLEEDGTSVRRFTGHRRNALVSQEACYYGPSFLIRSNVWLHAGPHRGGLSHDYDHWLRVEEQCWRFDVMIAAVARVLCTYNAHGRRRSLTARHLYDAPRWRAEALERRRAGEMLPLLPKASP